MTHSTRSYRPLFVPELRTFTVHVAEISEHCAIHSELVLIKELVVVLETPYLLCRGQVSSRQPHCNPTHVTSDLSWKEMGKKPTFINFSLCLTEGVIDVKIITWALAYK